MHDHARELRGHAITAGGSIGQLHAGKADGDIEEVCDSGDPRVARASHGDSTASVDPRFQTATSDLDFRDRAITPMPPARSPSMMRASNTAVEAKEICMVP